MDATRVVWVTGAGSGMGRAAAVAAAADGARVVLTGRRPSPWPKPLGWWPKPAAKACNSRSTRAIRRRWRPRTTRSSRPGMASPTWSWPPG